MKKLRDEIDKLMTETEAQADKVKEEDFQKVEKVSATCDIVIEQINKLPNNLDTLKENGDHERLLFSMKRAESQIISLEESLIKLNQDNTVREYMFEPNENMRALLNGMKVLGQLSFEISQSKDLPQNMKTTSISDQKAKKVIYAKDIQVTSSCDEIFTLGGSVVLPNIQILITDWDNYKIKLIDTNRDKILPEIQVSGNPNDITKVKVDEFAVTVESPNKTQFVSVSQNSLSKGREISVNGNCIGIAYNDKYQTLIVTYIQPGKVEILNMAGNAIKCLDKDSKGDQLFGWPICVALSPDMTGMFVTDFEKFTVTLMTLNGEVKAVYKDKKLQGLRGICVHKSGLVYVVVCYSHTVHQLDPVSGELKLLLGQKDELECPLSISYCKSEDKMYIGMQVSSVLKVFQMK